MADQFQLSIPCFLLTLCFLSSNVFGADECSRGWALDKIGSKSFKIIGLGLSSQRDSKLSMEEARQAAFKDISLQLESSIQSRSEVKESQSNSGFSATSILTSHAEDLVGLKAVKSGKRLEENVSHCEVYEFNVQAAYEDHVSKLSNIQDKIDKIKGLMADAHWTDVIREVPTVKPLISSHLEEIRRADLFKAYLNLPGPGWGERFEKTVAQLEDLDKMARSRLVFIFPQNQLEDVIAEVEGAVTNSGARVGNSVSEVKSGNQGFEVSMKSIGSARKSKTRLGLTVTRKVSIVVTDVKTKQRLSASNGLSIVGTSINNDEDEANANADKQLIAAVTDAIRNVAPELLKD